MIEKQTHRKRPSHLRIQRLNDEPPPTKTTQEPFNSGATYIQSQIQTYPQLVKTESVLQPVIDDLGLDMSVDALAQKVTASNPDGTMLVDIDVVDADAQIAADIANGVAESMCNQISAPVENDDGGTTPSPVDLDIVQQS